MHDYRNAQKTELTEFEDQEPFVLRDRGEIARALSELAQAPATITGYFHENRRYLLTVVLQVLPERGLVVMDPGPDPSANARALEEGSLRCVTQHNGILIKFTVSDLRPARYRGERVFAATLPDALLRLQRREFFRIRPPLTKPVTCEVPWHGERRRLKVLDIGYGGLALIDEQRQYDGVPGDILPQCELALPDFGSIQLDLEVRNIIPQTTRDGAGFQRLGCSFRQLPLDDSALLQRYIHRLQVDQRALGG